MIRQIFLTTLFLISVYPALQAQLYVKTAPDSVVNLNEQTDVQYIHVLTRGLVFGKVRNVVSTNTATGKSISGEMVTTAAGDLLFNEHSLMAIANYLYPRGWAFHSALVLGSEADDGYIFERIK